MLPDFGVYIIGVYLQNRRILMATIEFYANVKPESGDDGTGSLINHGAGSGVGFYGNGFGVSVPVNGYQTQTYVTNANGTQEGVRLNNTAVAGAVSANQVSVNAGTAINLQGLPNMHCPLNLRFSHTSAVRVQNCKLFVFDRVNKNNAASGVTTYAYEARHPSNTRGTALALTHRPSTAGHAWKKFNTAAAGASLDLTASPGSGGLNTDTSDTNTGAKLWTTTLGESHTNLQHDWYVALSSSPDSIGSKTDYGLFFQLEYLE